MSVYYGFNVERPPFNNVLVRQAFAAAVDREQIAQKALEYYFRNTVPATSLTPPEILSRDLYNEVGIPFDASRAKELLQQAGYSSVESFPPTTLLVSTRGKGAPGAYYQMAKLAVGMWQTNLGIRVEIEVADIPDYRAHFATDPPDIYQLGWVADYKDPDNFLKALFHSNSEVNLGHFSNQEFDRLVDEAARLTDPEKRLLLYIQAEQILTEQEAGVIPLYHCYRPTPYVY
jgi:ABC-type oligopeptide transport system substrate-binding subunit